MIGASSGVAFAGTIIAAERQQTLATLSARRFARWGLLAGALGAAVVAAALVTAMVPGGLAAASGWSLALGLAPIPVVGGVLGRSTATAILRAARRDLATAGEDDEGGPRNLRRAGDLAPG